MNTAKISNMVQTPSSTNTTDRNWFSRIFNRSNKKRAAVSNETTSLSVNSDTNDMEEYHNPMLGISKDFMEK